MQLEASLQQPQRLGSGSGRPVSRCYTKSEVTLFLLDGLIQIIDHHLVTRSKQSDDVALRIHNNFKRKAHHSASKRAKTYSVSFDQYAAIFSAPGVIDGLAKMLGADAEDLAETTSETMVSFMVDMATSCTGLRVDSQTLQSLFAPVTLTLWTPSLFAARTLLKTFAMEEFVGHEEGN